MSCEVEKIAVYKYDPDEDDYDVYDDQRGGNDDDVDWVLSTHVYD